MVVGGGWVAVVGGWVVAGGLAGGWLGQVLAGGWLGQVWVRFRYGSGMGQVFGFDRIRPNFY